MINQVLQIADSRRAIDSSIDHSGSRSPFEATIPEFLREPHPETEDPIAEFCRNALGELAVMYPTQALSVAQLAHTTRWICESWCFAGSSFVGGCTLDARPCKIPKK